MSAQAHAINSIDDLTPYQKAAVLSIALGDEISAKLFKNLSKNEIEAISKEIAFMKKIDPNIYKAVVKEFYQMLKAKEYATSGGIEYAKEILVKTLGPEEARRIIDKLIKLLESNVGFGYLENIDPKQLVKFIQNEHPQTIAVILSHLDQSKAAEVLSLLPKEIQIDIVVRMASLENISPNVIKRVSEMLETKMEDLSGSNVEIGGIRAVSEIINRMGRTESKSLIDQISEKNPDLASKIRDMMFVFEDIIKLSNSDIQEILKHIDKKDLTIALKGAPEELSKKFFSNMSSRAAETLKEEMEFLGPVKVKDVERAQKAIVDIVRRLDEEGVISISGGGEEMLE
ncbi:MAG: flagellar motor switch protein FliG [Desulfurella sp.]|uniref:Flagellar motor switch protein FliG n=4 Tax=Desulfurella TaxID=33001 RepID=A0A1G6HUY6_9BACT|nr:flagellar motor switch protein FliG [Desulfurella multipotens]SDB97645.1 flagellar motor switch protein FliG [Desulfurella multipotens]HEX12997.1 flagellar motor switch protein FliG [Desulfurella acetivorans]